jgi:hypothetical protein
MIDEILKLADSCMADRSANKLSTLTFMTSDREIEAFYRAAYNKGLDDAIRAAYDTVQYAVDFELADQVRLDIRKLEMN